MASRTRTRGGFVDHPATYLAQGCGSNPDANADYDDSERRVGEVETTVDFSNPNFRSRSARGEIINTLFDNVKETRVAKHNVWVRNYPSPCTTYSTASGDGYYRGMTASELDSYTAFVDPQPLRVIAGTSAKAGIAEPTVQGLLELAEFNKTARLLRAPVGKLDQLIRNIDQTRLRGRFSRLKSLKEFVSDNWLKYRYGFTPLVMTTNEILHGNLSVDSRPRRYTSRGFASNNATTTDTTTTPGSYWDVENAIHVHTKVDIRAGVLYEHAFTKFDRFGIRVYDVPAIAWELIPFSFVLDWFVNTGTLFRAVSPKANTNVLAQWTTTRTSVTKTYNYNGSWNGVGGTEVIPPSGKYTYTRVQTARLPGIETGLALRLHEIRFEKSIDWIHLADLFALMSGKFR